MEDEFKRDGSRTRFIRWQLVDIAIPRDISPGNVSRKPHLAPLRENRDIIRRLNPNPNA